MENQQSLTNILVLLGERSKAGEFSSLDIGGLCPHRALCEIDPGQEKGTYESGLSGLSKVAARSYVFSFLG